jgi:hypothetical protein
MPDASGEKRAYAVRLWKDRSPRKRRIPLRARNCLHRPLATSGTGIKRRRPIQAFLKLSETNGDRVRLENFDDQNFGYLRINVNKRRVMIVYISVDKERVKNEFDAVTVDLASRTFSS